MLFSRNRLRKKKDFERVMKDRASKSAAVSFLSARFINNDLLYSRIGFVVSKKVSKKAVIRNKIKRRLREISRDIIKGSEKGLDIVIFTKPEIAQSDFKQVKDVLESLLRNVERKT
ncbi:MAG: ribonuclease P protein component [Candidatus Pacebacteria bacterium]|nr:ribonuclease P protein component [Candidatus Paceibacterota bacterium]